MTVEEQVIAILSDQLVVNKEEITLEKDIEKDLGADKLDLVEIVLWLEEEFQIEIPDEEADKFVKVENIVDYIREKTKKSGE